VVIDARLGNDKTRLTWPDFPRAYGHGRDLASGQHAVRQPKISLRVDIDEALPRHPITASRVVQEPPELANLFGPRDVDRSIRSVCRLRLLSPTDARQGHHRRQAAAFTHPHRPRNWMLGLANGHNGVAGASKQLNGPQHVLDLRQRAGRLEQHDGIPTLIGTRRATAARCVARAIGLVRALAPPPPSVVAALAGPGDAGSPHQERSPNSPPQSARLHPPAPGFPEGQTPPADVPPPCNRGP